MVTLFPFHNFHNEVVVVMLVTMLNMQALQVSQYMQPAAAPPTPDFLAAIPPAAAYSAAEYFKTFED